MSQRRPSEVLESGVWGRRIRIFFHEFYGEGFELQPGQEVCCPLHYMVSNATS